MLFALINGFPLFYFDSLGYVREPIIAIASITDLPVESSWPNIHKVIRAGLQTREGADADHSATIPVELGSEGEYTASRSVYYGFFTWFGYLAGDYWLTIFLQGLTVSYPIALLMLRCLDLGFIAYSGTMLCLVLTTTVGPFVALLMPDVFAGALIVSLSISYIMWESLNSSERIGITGILLFSLLVHSSHIVLFAAMISILVIVDTVKHRIRTRLLMFIVMASIFMVSIMGAFAYNGVIKYMTGKDAVVMPHLMAHIIDMGPGYAYVTRDCSANQFVICRYRDQLPQDWITFLFGKSDNLDLRQGVSGGVYANASDETRRSLSREQLSFFFAVLRSDPLGVIEGMTLAALQQVYRFSLVDLQPLAVTVRTYKDRLPPQIATGATNSLAVRSPTLLNLFSMLNYLSVACSVVILASLVVIRRGSPFAATESPNLQKFGFLVLTGVLLNALVCATIASPYDRFQARVIWLVPLVAIVTLADAFKHYRSASRCHGELRT
jgi:hypothetical protein